VAQITMERVRPGSVPFDAGTAVQEDPSRPVFSGNGPNDYICVECGTVLAVAMDPDYMTFRVRVKCARCKTVNVAENDNRTPEERRRRRNH
jgi:phage FluMu protein Com